MSTPPPVRARRRSSTRATRLLVAAACAFAAPGAGAATYTWSGGGGIYSKGTYWDDPGNWLGAAVPPASADVIIGNSFASGTNIVPTSATVNSLTFNTTAGVTIVDDGSIDTGTAAHPLELVSGNITRNNVSGTEATQTIAAPLIIDASGTWNINGANSLTISGQIFRTPGTGRAPTVTKTGTGTVILQGPIHDYTRSFYYAFPILDPLWTGSLVIDSGTVGIVSYASKQPLPQTIHVSSGASLHLIDTVANDAYIAGSGISYFPPLGYTGAIQVDGGNTLNTLTVASSALISGAGDLAVNSLAGPSTSTLAISCSSVDITAASTFAGPIALNLGYLEAHVPEAIGSSSGITVPAGRQLLVDGVGTINCPLTLAGAGLDGSAKPGALVSQGTLDWSGPVTLSGDTSFMAGLTFSLTISGAIADGSAGYGITKQGNGTLVLSGANTYGGSTSAAQGTLVLAAPSAASTGPILVAPGATVALSPDLGIANAITLNGAGVPGAGALSSPSGANTWSGAVSLQSDASVDIADGSLNIAGPVTGAFPLTKTGGGSLSLGSAANAYQSLTVADGTLAVLAGAGLPPASPTTVNAGADVRLLAPVTVNNPLSLNGAGPAGLGALRLAAAVDAGWQGSVTLLTDASVGVDAGSLTISGPVHGPGKLTKVGPGRVIFSGAADYPVLNVAEGPAQIAGPSAAPPGLTVNVAAGGALELAGNFNASCALGLAGSGIVGAGALRAISGSTDTFSGPLTLAGDAAVGVDANTTFTIDATAHPISDGGLGYALTKVGPGTLHIIGDSAFTGGLVISGGIVAADHDGALGAPGAPVTVNPGAKLQFAASTTTSGRTFTLNNGSIAVGAGATLTYSDTRINGGYLRGPGTQVVGPNCILSGVTPLPGVDVQIADATLLANFTNAGNITVDAPSTWDGGFNSGAASLVVNAALAANSFENDGLIAINPGATLSNDLSDLASTGGSSILIGSKAAPGGTLDLLNNTTLNLHGALLVNNGAVNGTVNVGYGSLAMGAGTFGAVNVETGGRFSPGNSPGLATSTTGTLGPGGGFVLEISDAAGAPGTGFDQWQLTGALAITAGSTTNSRFIVQLSSLDAGNNPGPASGFDPNGDQQWAFIHTAGGITGFDPTRFSVDASGFANPTNGGVFGIAQSPSGADLLVTYSAAQWAAAGSGSWPVAGNWLGGVPTISANFLDRISTPATISLDGPRSVQGLRFDNPSRSYTIVPGAAGSLTLDNAGNPIPVEVISGSHTIAAPITLLGDSAIDVSAGASLQLAGPLTASAVTITRTGAGALELPNLSSVALNLLQGTTAACPGATLFDLTGLSVAPGASLDLRSADMILPYAGPSPYAMYAALIRTGAITTSLAHPAGAADATIALVDNEQLHLIDWHGQAISDGVDFSQLLFAYTYAGDANLDGMVTQADYRNVISGMGRSGATWSEGDLNGDGLVTIDDLALVTASLGAGTGGNSGQPLAAIYGRAVAPVPEPTGLLLFAPLAILSRRRRPRRIQSPVSA